ncbi:TetR/AcrR family transcriptional regulator [Ciceribacter sp. RN22]|uniref:TetR/AcrR family transcriptional regulator n=1 Tax=Ciceribacter sp. RN22 TaxID=2954932 RepID=UPI0020938DF4|nr:TetR family transcriptional regulator [Ciceribacter sp. RN22]MCO6179398.1 TetR family transcriptional regulator [Ciceribacter sp. RN22]
MTDGQKPSERRRGRPKKGKELDVAALFDAAVANFAEWGFERASLRKIAGQAGVDVALISYRYGSKLGLWTAVVDAVAEEAITRIRESQELCRGLPPNEQMERLCREMVDLVGARPLFAQLLISEIMTNADSERKALIEERLARPVFDLLLGCVRTIRGPDEGPADVDMGLSLIAAMSMIGAVISTQSFFRRLMPSSSGDQQLFAQLAVLMRRLL